MIHLPRKLEIDDLDKFVMPSNPCLSPSGENLAFVVTRIRENSFFSTLYIVDSEDGGSKRYFDNAVNPSWSPDGSQIFFLSDRGMKEGDRGTGIWVTNLCGEPRLVTTARGGIEQPSWNGDGSKILFLSYVGEEQVDERVIDDLPFYIDGVGWTDHRKLQLHSVDVSSGIVTQLTDGEADVVSFSPSNKGGSVCYTVSKIGPISMGRVELHVLDTKNGGSRLILSSHAISRLGWSPEDDFIYFFGNDFSHGFAAHSSVWVIKPAHGEPINLTSKLDRDVTGGLISDLVSPFTGPPSQPYYDDHIYFLVSDRGKINIQRVDVKTAEIEPVLEGDFSISEFSISKGRIAYVKTNIDEPPEVWLRNGEKEQRVTSLSAAVKESIALQRGEHFTLKASDGEDLDGWLIKPRGWRRGGKYPAILEIHGGPKAMYGYAPMFDFQVWAAAGYAVIYMNPRGSDGYSQGFAELEKRFGTRDYQDLIEAVRFVVDTNEWIDGDRLGVTGMSYGGYMTNWIIGHTDLFRCAISQNGISSHLDMFGVSDIGYFFTTHLFGSDPWNDPETWKERSPITYAPNVETPTLFIHSMFDYRCPVDQSMQMFTALKYLGKPTRLILYNEGSHLFKFFGPPAIRKKRLRDILDWFNQYLK
jgi:dipeptidyl aminopeptidase/acylaminoacyl peptidase